MADLVMDAPLATGTLTVRLLQPEDVVDVLPICARMHSRSRYHRMPYDAVRVQKLLESSINAQQLGTLVLLHPRDGIVGAGMLSVQPYLFSTQFLAYDLGIYIVEDYRSFKASTMLIHAMEQWARAHGASRLLTSVTAPEGMDEVRSITKLYVSIGYDLLGTMLAKELAP